MPDSNAGSKLSSSVHHAKVSSDAYRYFISSYRCCKYRCMDLIPLATKIDYAKFWDVPAAERRQRSFDELKRTQVDCKNREGPFVTFASLFFDVRVRVDLPGQTALVPICRRALLALTMVDESVWLSDAKQLFCFAERPAYVVSSILACFHSDLVCV